MLPVPLSNQNQSHEVYSPPSTKSGFDSPGFVGILALMNSLSDLTVVELRRVIVIKEQIESLQKQLEALAGEAGEARPTEAPAPAKRKLSAVHRRKLVKALAKARKARWAKAKAAKTATAPKKRRISAKGRAALSAAAKARWAKFRAAKAA